MLSQPSAEARGGRAEASSHICVVMVNFRPGAGKRWRFPKISQALCGCWAFLGSGMEWASIGLCQHADRVSGIACVPLEMPPGAAVAVLPLSGLGRSQLLLLAELPLGDHRAGTGLGQPGSMWQSRNIFLGKIIPHGGVFLALSPCWGHVPAHRAHGV